MTFDLTATSKNSNLQVAQAQVDTQVTTAKSYPRDARDSIEKSLQHATFSQEIAQSCIYSLPVGASTIDGPSIRLAEIIAYNWGNVRISARIVEINESAVIVEGICWDLEKSGIYEVPVRRSIQKDRKTGKTNEFMINNAVNAAISIAIRNAIFRAIPKVYVEKIYNECKRVAIGEIKNISKQRDSLICWFEKAGVPRARILAYYGLNELNQITEEHMIEMFGAKNALQDRTVDVTQLFNSNAIEDNSTDKDKLNRLNDKLKGGEKGNA